LLNLLSFGHAITLGGLGISWAISVLIVILCWNVRDKSLLCQDHHMGKFQIKLQISQVDSHGFLCTTHKDAVLSPWHWGSKAELQCPDVVFKLQLLWTSVINLDTKELQWVQKNSESGGRFPLL
jgi:hypothetical protein